MPREWRWKPAEPRDQVPRGAWWRVFNDPHLDALEAVAESRNQDLKAAAARVEQARAVARISRADLFPSLRGSGSFTRYRTSGNAASPVDFPIPSFQAQQWQTPLDLSYELDLWGKVRSGFAAARHRTLALEAARQSLLLTLQADVAVNYFGLVAARQQIATLEAAIDLRRQALGIFKQRLEAGVGSEFEVERTKVELATAEADLAIAKQREAELVNALAVLCGQPAAEFEAVTAEELPAVPGVQPALPSSLLERRPDVAEAERELAARVAEVGVAQAAFYPSIRLTTQTGFSSEQLKDLFLWDSRYWGISPSISVPLFEGGRLRSDLARARAAVEEATANYRQRLLVAFREVDDSLAALRFLADQRRARAAAVQAAGSSARIALSRFGAGTVSFLEVVDASTLELSNELARIGVVREQFAATVRLIKALGGGWGEPASESPHDETRTSTSATKPRG